MKPAGNTADPFDAEARRHQGSFDEEKEEE